MLADLLRDNAKGIDRDQGTTGRIRQRLRRHDADAQAGVTARAMTDDDRGQVAGCPTLSREQLLYCWGKVASMAASLVKPAYGQQLPTGGNGNLPDPVGGFQDQQ